MNELRILDRTGDTKVTWDDDDPKSKANARKEVERLKQAGYMFFLVDGTPADEVAAGKGELVARYATAEEIVEPEAEATETPVADEPPKRRGRPAKKAVAVPVLRGG